MSRSEATKASASVISIKERPTISLNLCIITFSADHPAFKSLKSLLWSLLGGQRVNIIWSKSFLRFSHPLLKPFLYTFQEIVTLIIFLLSVRRNKADIVVMFQGYLLLTSLAVKILGRKLVLFIGGSALKTGYYDKTTSIGKISSYFNVFLTSVCHRMADKIVVLSRSMIGWLGLEAHVSKVRLATPFPDHTFGKKFQISKDYDSRELIIGYVGSLERSKGIVVLIDAISLVVKGRKDLKFLIIGDGSQRRILEERFQDCDVVRFVGKVNHEELPKYYNEMRLLVLPSFSEGVPAVILEAMSCGTPVLASPVGGIPDFIIDGETSFLLTSSNPSRIAERIIDITNNPDLLKKVSQNAYAWVRENLDTRKTLEAWGRLFEELCESNSRTGR